MAQDLMDINYYIDEFCKTSDEIKILKTENDKAKEFIKDYVLNNSDGTVNTGAYKVTVSTVEKTTLNQDIALKVLSRLDGAKEIGLIKTVEVIDFDRLEELLYAGDIPQDILSDLEGANVTTTTTRLTYKAVK